MNGIEVKVNDVDLREVNKALYSYSRKLGDKVVIDSLKAGAKIVQKSARKLAPISKTGQRGKYPHARGNLRRSITIKKSRINNNENTIGVYLTISKKAFYGRFIENGWEVRGKKRTEENTPGKRNRNGVLKLSRAESNGRNSLPGRVFILGKFFMRNAFTKDKANAVRMIIAASSAGAELLARKQGL